ncbi:MAG: Serine protease AprX [Firmicutes bacterium]|nr:Serine protease AprX [Bacillota bacterium]MDI6706194.1 S8 family peptidase [Bacillota bacterium]
MAFQDVNWIRSYANKFCPTLRKKTLEWYRPSERIPCFVQDTYKSTKQKLMKIPVIVQLENTRDNRVSARAVAESAGCRLKKELPLINSFATEVNASSLETLVRDSNVRKIWYDGEVKALLDVATPSVQCVPLWENSVTGKGVTVAVLDTGIYNHPDLEGRIIGFADFINNEKESYDDNGHGTHVAGDIASNGSKSDARYKGPAPEANLVGVKVLNQQGSGTLSVLVEGIQWCIDNKQAYDIRIINLSLGSEAKEPYADDPICQAVEKAWRSDIIVCVAAGNSGPAPRTINTPGIHPSVITVGALDDMNTAYLRDDNVANFSSRGPTADNLNKPDVLAPGVNIISLRSPGSTLDKQKKGNRINKWYISLSGTSMATPICAGVIAQMLQADSSLTPDMVKARLIETAKPYPDIDKNIQGFGIIDARNAARLN